jgi:hypothetical protein
MGSSKGDQINHTWKTRENVLMSSQLFNPYPANMEYRMGSNNASKWKMGFNSVFKGLMSLE